MKNINLKVITLALITAFFWSCEKDTENFYEEEAITEMEDTGYISTKADPDMTYYLHGKQIVDTNQIENLLKTAKHMEIKENNLTFYPTKEEQKSRLETNAKTNSPAVVRRNTYLFHYGMHNNQPFHHMTNSSNHNYRYGAWIHHKSNRRFYAPLWQKITRGLSIINHNPRYSYPDYRSRFTFFSQNGHRGSSVTIEVRANSYRRNIHMPWHIGSHRNY
ncbi:hypothetical protein [Kordia jejudonensis]|uniref:hypothetical protein n=1 Tax=Kordia jejudonensis TaxID=1348245 RepID=UPI000629C0CC|nr:hypothetical protein [Kordia jejudonensis]